MNAASVTSNEMSDDGMKHFFNLDPFVPATDERREGLHAEAARESECHLRSIADLLEIPDYLSMKKNNRQFEDMLEQKMYPITGALNMEPLRTLAILIYQSNMLELEISLWKTYFKAGTGHLEEGQSGSNMWPPSIRTMIQLARRPTTTSDPHCIQVTNVDCFNFVREHLRNLDERQQQLKQELLRKQTAVSGLTNTIEQMLRTFVEEKMRLIRLHFDHRIKLFEFDYREYVLDLQFTGQNPTTEQLELSKRLTHRKYEYESVRQENLWIQQQLQKKKLLQVLSHTQLTLSSSIQSLTDMDLRNHLSNRHHQIMQQYRQEMIEIIVATMQGKLNELTKLFDNEIAAMWQSQRSLPVYLRMNQTVLDLIERHLVLIREKVQCIYDYKEATNAI